MIEYDIYYTIRILTTLVFTGVFVIIIGHIFNIAEYGVRKAKKIIEYGYLIAMASMVFIVLLLTFNYILKHN
jgi:hypothetical protein